MSPDSDPYRSPEQPSEAPVFSAALYLVDEQCKPALLSRPMRVVLTDTFFHVGDRTIPFDEIGQALMVQTEEYREGLRVRLKPMEDRPEESIYLADRSMMGEARTDKLVSLRNHIASKLGQEGLPRDKVYSFLAYPKLIWEQQILPALHPETPLWYRGLLIVCVVLELILPGWVLLEGTKLGWIAGLVSIWVALVLLPLCFFAGQWILAGITFLVAKVFRLPLEYHKEPEELN